MSRACLGKMMHFIHKWLKTTVFLTLRCSAFQIFLIALSVRPGSSLAISVQALPIRKPQTLFEFSLRLSRACLGKMIIFSIKWISAQALPSRACASSKIRRSSALNGPLQENTLFLSFPYVCPEPVLTKGSFSAQIAQKDACCCLSDLISDGWRWCIQRSRHCLGDFPGRFFASHDHEPGSLFQPAVVLLPPPLPLGSPFNLRRSVSSWGVHSELLLFW